MPVTRSSAKKVFAEEKEAPLAATEMKPSNINGKHGYEFGGPVGVLLMMIALPVVVSLSYMYCNGGGPCTIYQSPSFPPMLMWRFVVGCIFGHLIVVGWIVLQALIYLLPVGKVRLGDV